MGASRSRRDSRIYYAAPKVTDVTRMNLGQRMNVPSPFQRGLKMKRQAIALHGSVRWTCHRAAMLLLTKGSLSPGSELIVVIDAGRARRELGVMP